MIEGNLTLSAVFHIVKKYSHEETAKKIGQALGVQFEFDDSGRWEEFPAYISLCFGIEIAILAPPEPEFDLREIPTDNYQLTTRDHTNYIEGSAVIDLSVYLASLIESKTDLVCEQI